jgi:DNA-binding NtrC family response regulator
MARRSPVVLVVDDDSATRQGLTALLQSWGYTTFDAADGMAALKICDKELPHAVVTDLMMPGISGLQFVESLGERVRQMAIVFVTGQATVDTAVQAIKLGAYDYLPKPLEPQRLRITLERSRCITPETRVAPRFLRGAHRKICTHAPALPANQ